MKRWGLNGKLLELAWKDPSPADPYYLKNSSHNPKQKSLIHLIEGIYKRQLLMTEKLDIVAANMTHSIERSLILERLPYPLTSTEKSTSFSLRNLSAIIWVDAVTYYMFGDQLYMIKPNVTTLMRSFNDEAWKMIFDIHTMPHQRYTMLESKLWMP